MWQSETKARPDEDVQVVGIVARDGGFDEVAWWTRTNDGWYVSDKRGYIGHRDAMTPEQSEGPHYWQHAPKAD